MSQSKKYLITTITINVLFWITVFYPPMMGNLWSFLGLIVLIILGALMGLYLLKSYRNERGTDKKLILFGFLVNLATLIIIIGVFVLASSLLEYRRV